MVVICCATDVKGYDEGTAELSNAALHITQDTTIIEKLRF